MINKIVMENIASYKQKAELLTDKKINLIYGLNGTGKSTLSNYLYNMNDSKYASCSVDGLADIDDVLVYNQRFINDNFYETEDIQGIFTLSKTNAKAKINIEQAKLQLKQLNVKIRKKEESKELLQKTHVKQVENAQNKIWKIKIEYSGGDRILAYCLTNLKSRKEALSDHIGNIKKVDLQPKYTIDDLKEQAKMLQDGDDFYSYVPNFAFDMSELEGAKLFSKIIVGNKNSTVSEVIDKLGNSDWVQEGLKYVQMQDDDRVCPFCQNKTLNNELLNSIKDYFDESYQSDIQKINKILEEYHLKSQIISSLEIYLNNFVGKKHEKDLRLLFNSLQRVVEKNIQKMKQKCKEPSAEIEIESSEEMSRALASLIVKINEEIKILNDKISNRQKELEKIKIKFWQLMRWEYDSVIETLKKDDIFFKKSIATIEGEIGTIKQEIKSQEKVLTLNQKQTVNLDEAIGNINQGLLDIGIDVFSIEKYSEEDALYHLRREDEVENVFKSLSEGEKMVISFLYFIELCKGERTTDQISTNKIVMIDDPISSLSHIYIFNIGRLIHNEFLRTDKYDQIFILTHSLYFYYELTCLQHDDREKTQKLFRLIKNKNGSVFLKMKYEEIQNDYQAYWHIIKDENQHSALIANCMRNIMEYFFNFVEKQDFSNVFQKPNLRSTRFDAFYRYMNRESHSKGQNVFDLKEFDYASFKEAFRLVFVELGYAEHYKKMMK
ncbi:AAA family ATPase [Propionispira raffinosivorans]|uniref:AAA family ATPase n=1 Tax=Propionispira raffinosivorans TaxID=86959 RepID=UPI00035E510F|nr:AAA family ATPase [Propionispira raffinosivorans]